MMKHIKKIALGVLLLCMLAMPAYAANHVSTIMVYASIEADGAMQVTQVWDTDFSEGTESYIPMNLPSHMSISNFKVSDKNGSYETLSDWNIDAGFNEKANKCGINRGSNGIELCFGISEYGKNSYTMEYRVENAVSGYSDADGVNFRFVNDKMNTTPTDVAVSISLADGTPITDEISDIWAFGFDGKVVFSDGSIVAITDKPIATENHVTVMFNLKKGVLSPAHTVSDSFETVKQRAFDGSDYDSSDAMTTKEAIIFAVTAITVPLVLILSAKYFQKKKKQKALAAIFEKHGYFRDIPNSGNTNATYELGKLFGMCEDGAVLATAMLRLIDLGCLSPESQESVGFMGKTKETVNLRLMGGDSGKMNEYDEYLYTVLEGAAGADGVLQAKELEKYADSHDTLLRDYITKCETAGKQYLNQKHCLKRWSVPLQLKYLTESGETEFGELYGFKKYLEDFSLIAERGVGEMPIWQELLSYAALFGIADKVAEQMQELYPNIAAQVVSYNQSIYTACSYQYLLYSNMRAAENRREQKKRSSGSGGRASFGGGGGSFGGGSSGGTR